MATPETQPFDRKPITRDEALAAAQRVVTPDGEVIEFPTEIHHGNAGHVATKAIEIYKMAKKREKQAGAPWKELQDKAKDIIERAFQQLSIDSLESSAGKAYIQSTYSQVKYDARALDALSASDPDLAAKLQPHRKEIERGGWIVIR